jgi:hypothetical protein
LESIFMPSARALGGMRERKRRAGLERRAKGLKDTRTSVRNLVIIVGDVWLVVRSVDDQEVKRESRYLRDSCTAVRRWVDVLMACGFSWRGGFK